MDPSEPYTLGVALSEGGPFEVVFDSFHVLPKWPRIDRVQPPIIWLNTDHDDMVDRAATLKVLLVYNVQHAALVVFFLVLRICNIMIIMDRLTRDSV